MPHRRPLFALLAFALVLLSIPALAQIDKASIEAVVLDQSKAALPGVTVTLVRPETGYETSAVTDSAPRRSISKAQNPSEVPMSKQRFPASEAGIPILAAAGRVSNMPGVTIPPGNSSVWYQAKRPTSSA